MGLMNKSYLPFTPAMAAWVKSSRVKVGVSQLGLGQELGFKQSYLSTLEGSRAKLVSPKRWQKIEAYFAKQGIAPVKAEKPRAIAQSTPRAHAIGEHAKRTAKRAEARKASGCTCRGRSSHARTCPLYCPPPVPPTM